MLTTLRKNASSWLIKTILMLIVVVFILWGGYSYQEKQRSYLVRVDDTYITVQQYGKAYDQLRDLYRQKLGQNFSEEMLKKINIKQQVLDLLIDQTLLLKKASELGVRVSTAELQDTIRSIPAFQVNGEFNIKRYRTILQQNRISPESFEYELLQSLTVKKLEDLVMRQVTISDKEVLDYVRMLKTDKQFLCTSFPWDKYESRIVVTEESLKAYYEAHQKSYEEPEKRRIAYVLFNPSDFTKNISVSESEVKDYYEAHQRDYRQEKEVRARHILFRLNPKVSQEEVENVRRKAMEVLSLAKSGHDFATLAKKYSEDLATKAKGGDLGYFTRSQMVKEFADRAFNMRVGEISDLVKSSFGFHIIKVEDIRPERELSFEEVKDRIKQKLLEEKAKEVAYSKAREFADATFASQDITQAATKYGYPLIDLPQWLSASQNLPPFSENPNITKTLFELPEKGVSEVLEAKSGFIVAQVKEIKAPRIIPFEEVKTRVEKDFRREKSEEEALRDAEKLLTQAISLGSLEKASKGARLSATRSPFLNRLRPDANFGIWGEELERLMDLTEFVPFPEKPIKGMTAYMVCQWVESKLPDEKVVEEEAKRFKPILIEQISKSYWEGWKKSLRNQVKIEILQEI
ncbi:MAG: SurA N-terminal domain-containing protein [Syntrophobacterales bacterium]|nr:SurA N-terminal domain-containing protein [Syntrophobacterales bacterium]